MTNETWVDIEGYEGLYQVSNLGNVKSLNRVIKYRNNKKAFHKERLLVPKENFGYLRVTLSKDNKRKEYRIHRLVAKAFIPNPENKPIVNHLDENKQNNKSENLEWSTQDENFNYSKVNYLKGVEKKYKKVSVVKDTGEFLLFKSIKECLDVIGISDRTLRRTNGEVVKKGKFKGWCFKIEKIN